MLDVEALVEIERHGDDVVTLALRRPPANALGLPIIDGLDAALDEVPEARVIVVASRVVGFFAAGADIKHMATVDGAEFAAYGDALRAMLGRVAAADRVTIAAIDGLALGGGLELALACTLRVGSERATFGLPEVKLGLIPGAGGTQRLPRLVGRGRALDMMLTGRSLDAAEAHAIGLIDRLVAPGEAETVALALAREVRALSQPALHAVVRSVDSAADLPLGEGLGHERSEEQALFERGEAREGITAFLEKRPPDFA
jgi:enoyl-CoA hydratase